MGKYCSVESVQTRLAGKVKFGNPGEPEDPNADRMSLTLLNQLIAEAESQLELDLMERYALPFQTIEGLPFSSLPDTTRNTLRTVAELLSVVRVLETDFGRGTSANAEKYTASCQKRYDATIAQLMGRQEETKNTSRQWKTRPLDCLAVAFNNQGDNGFKGRVHNSSDGRGPAEYAKDQINRPDLTVFNAGGFYGTEPDNL